MVLLQLNAACPRAMPAHDMNVAQPKCCFQLPFLAFTVLRLQSCKTARILDSSL